MYNIKLSKIVLNLSLNLRLTKETKHTKNKSKFNKNISKNNILNPIKEQTN